MAASDDSPTDWLRRAHPRIRLAEFEIEPEVAALLPAALCRTHQLIAVNLTENTLVVAMVDPKDTVARAAVRAAIGPGLELESVECTSCDLTVALREYLG